MSVWHPLARALSQHIAKVVFVLLAGVCAWVEWSIPEDDRGVGGTLGTATAIAGGVALLAATMMMAISAKQSQRHYWSWLGTITLITWACFLAATKKPEDLEHAGAFIAAMALSFGGLKYLLDREDARRRERWSRINTDWTEFVANGRLVCAIHMLECNDPRLKRIGEPMALREYEAWKNPLDQVLELLLRLAFFVKHGELDADDACEMAGWYFRRVAEHPQLRAYCRSHGYERVINFAQEHCDAHVVD